MTPEKAKKWSSNHASKAAQVYLQRVWTIYEQYVACSLGVPVTFVMPEDATALLSQQISRGDAGILEVTESLGHVDAKRAEAWDPRDEQRVKEAIQDSVGFQRVNQHVKSAMVHWIGTVVREKFQRLLDAEDRARESPRESRDGSQPRVQ